MRDAFREHNNIYVINHLMNRQLERKGEKLILMFVDLKAAFDIVDRGALIRTMRERGIREGLARRVEELLEKTKSRVRVGEEISEEFCTAREVRQDCPLSPFFFNILLADLEEVMGKVKWGGVRLTGERVYTLTYADDIMMAAKEEDEMRSMMGRLEEYLERKGLELNTSKTKIILQER